MDVPRIDITDTAGQHDRLVITAQLRTYARPDDFLLIAAKIAAQVRATEFIIEGRSANRPVEHNIQCRGDATRLAEILFPRLLEAWNSEVRHRKAAQASFRLGANASSTFIAYLAARTGRRTRERCNGGRMIVCFHLHQNMCLIGVRAVMAVGIGIETFRSRPLNHRGIV